MAEVDKKQLLNDDSARNRLLAALAAEPTGVPDWAVLKSVLKSRLKANLEHPEWKLQVLDVHLEQIHCALDAFTDAPFTLQRLCELLLHPEQYTNLAKYLRAIEKVLLIGPSPSIPLLQSLSTSTECQLDDPMMD